MTLKISNMKAEDKVIIKATNTKAVICAVGIISNITYYTLTIDNELIKENGRTKFFTADDIKTYDSLVEFLDNNPNTAPEQKEEEMTPEEEEAYYLNESIKMDYYTNN